MTFRDVGRQALGLSLMAAGLWFAFLHSRDGAGHFDHTALHIGVGVALFGALIVVPATVKDAVKEAGRVIGRRSSTSTPAQKGPPDAE